EFSVGRKILGRPGPPSFKLKHPVANFTLVRERRSFEHIDPRLIGSLKSRTAKIRDTAAGIHPPMTGSPCQVANLHRILSQAELCSNRPCKRAVVLVFRLYLPQLNAAFITAVKERVQHLYRDAPGIEVQWQHLIVP